MSGDMGTSNRIPELRAYNRIFENTGAGVLIDNAGGEIPIVSVPPGEAPPAAVGGNVVQGNYIGRHRNVNIDPLPNEIGVLIRGGNSKGNLIGGSGPNEGNIIRNNRRAGIEIDGVLISNQAESNRVMGNIIQGQGWDLPEVCDQLSAEPGGGVGVLIHNGTNYHIIGGANPKEGNTIGTRKAGQFHVDGNRVGVWIDHSDYNQVAGNDFGYNEEDRGNVCAGVLILNGAENLVGPGNQFDENDKFVPPSYLGLGSLVISGGAENRVLGNWFGPPINFHGQSMGSPHIKILDSPDNVIGGLGATKANVIFNGDVGIHIDGPGSTGNRIMGNTIGIATEPFETPPYKSNRDADILISGGASRNIIGGTTTMTVGDSVSQAVPAGNIIHANWDGVRVDGANSVGNTIMYNSISDHTFSGRLGIKNINGGNDQLAPPVLTDFDGSTITGTVAASEVPDGSVVQIFTDPADEGYHFMTNAIVDNGEFSAAMGMWVFPNICATVTHVDTGSTSEFSCFPGPYPTNGLLGLDIRRVNDPPENINIEAGRSSAVAALKLTTGEGSVLVESMRFLAQGSADESTAITDMSLYRDDDEDGLLSEPDTLLAGGVSVPVNDGEAVFEELNAAISANSTEHWLLVTGLDAQAIAGETIEFKLIDNSKVESGGLFPPTLIVETGTFPLYTDVALITERLITPADIEEALMTGGGYDADMDVNGDGVVDVADLVAAERAYND
jgi:hypothetical protein